MSATGDSEEILAHDLALHRALAARGPEAARAVATAHVGEVEE
nr:hypothetical protein [Streptomyces sp. WELS2]